MPKCLRLLLLVASIVGFNASDASACCLFPWCWNWGCWNPCDPCGWRCCGNSYGRGYSLGYQPVGYASAPHCNTGCGSQSSMVPVTTYRDVTVDMGSYQQVWVPRMMTRRVPQTSWVPQTGMPTMAGQPMNSVITGQPAMGIPQTAYAGTPSVTPQLPTLEAGPTTAYDGGVIWQPGVSNSLTIPQADTGTSANSAIDDAYENRVPLPRLTDSENDPVISRTPRPRRTSGLFVPVRPGGSVASARHTRRR